MDQAKQKGVFEYQGYNTELQDAELYNSFEVSFI